MESKKLINIWLAFRILGLKLNFDNFVYCPDGKFKFAVKIEIYLSESYTLATGRLYMQNSLVTAHCFCVCICCC